MAEHDRAVADAQRAGRIHIFEVSGAQELGTDDADEAEPGEQQHDAEQDEEAGRQDGCDDQEDVEHRHRGPDLDETLHQKIGPAAEITLHGTGRHADSSRGERQCETEEDRDAEAVDHAGHDIARLIVGAEPVHVAEHAVRVLSLQRIGGAAGFLVHQPEGRCWCRMRHFGIHRAVGIADRRPDHPAVGIDLV